MIHFHCPNCSKKVTVADEHAGKRGKCPKCQHVVVIPNPKKEEPGPQHEALAEQQRSGGYGVAELTKPCPYCSELILDTASKCKHCGEWLGAERIVRETSTRETKTKRSPTRLIVKIALLLAITSLLGAGLWVWNNDPESILEPDFLLRQRFEAVAREELPEVFKSSETAMGIFDRMRAGESVEQAMKNASEEAADLDFSNYTVVRTEVHRLSDSEFYDALGTAYWEEVENPDGKTGSFQLGRRKDDGSWVRYEEPVDPAIETFIKETQPLIEAARKLESLREIGGNYLEYKEAVLALRTKMKSAPDPVDTNSERFLESIDKATIDFGKAIDYWSKSIQGSGNHWDDLQQSSFESGDRHLATAMMHYGLIERQVE